MTTRQSYSRKERRAQFVAQGGRFNAAGEMIALADCGCGCGRPMTFDEAEGEHYTPVALGNEAKPDALWHPHCHAIKTKKDRAEIAKVKRIRRKLAGTWRPSRKTIPSRPFNKSLRRRFDGTVEARNG